MPTAILLLDVKWLINTGHLAGRWPPRSPANRTSARRAPAAAVAPNAISRFQMVDGGTVAVLVMPTGDGGHRCCGRGWTSHFSLGFVRLRHGFNNLYPTVQPFPDWSAFVDAAGPPPEPVRNGPRPRRAADESSDSSECVPEVTTKSSPEPHIDTYGGRNRQRIVNAVDAFLDDRGRILWVLDTGDEDACDSDTDDPSPPKFLAIDLHTNQTISTVSLSRVWRPGASRFQNVVAVYPDAIDDDDADDHDNATTGGAAAAQWPLVVISDSGTNRLLVYSYCVDRFTEIGLPRPGDENGGGDEEEGDDGPAANRSNGARRPRCRPRAWPVPRAPDVLYTVPLYPRPGRSALLVTYRGRPHVHRLRLQPSGGAADYPAANTSRVPPAPVTATLSTLGRKPCVMVLLGSDRRRTDLGGTFAGGGTTVYFRMADANDVWSWDTQLCGVSVGLIDPRNFRLVRRGRTCRFPVAVSAAPAAGSGGGGKGEPDAESRVRQVVWVLETNAADHFAGTADRMGANAKLQPVEATAGVAGNCTVAQLKPSLRMRPSAAGRRRNATAAPRPKRCFPAQ